MHIEHARSGSEGCRFWMSAAVRFLRATALCCCHDALRGVSARIDGQTRARPYSSGLATTSVPSGMTMTFCPSSGLPSIFCRKLFGMPVVRLIRGLPTKSGSSFVGQSWIQ